MSLIPGTRLGPYEITAAIGAGGMGEVYRAKDVRLNRDVAIKVLPEAFALDADRLARFTREAQVLASLNHPHIAAIYGIEEAGSTRAFVMELVEGEDLSVHIARGAIPLADVLPIARQIAEALEAAHEQHIIHRDLKPANIKVRPDGRVKVLDFGLAKAMEPASTSDRAAVLANSPTITSPALTERGVILGTAAYMSPEQAAGKAVDKRSDLWAFGVVLLEMLTGRRVFDGPDAAHVIAAVLKSEPDWTGLPAETPSAVRRLLRRCLEKDRKRRLDSAADARLEIEEALTAPSTSDGAVPSGHAPRSTSARLLPWAFVATLTIALAILGAFVWRGMSRERPLPVYASLNAPADYALGDDDPIASLPTRTPMVFTPDGRSLIIQAARANKPQLFLQSLDRLDARPIAGTDDARVPFVSPDGQWVGFWSANELKKVPIEGGAATAICPFVAARGPVGVAWGPGDIIVFGGASGRIWRVPASGGTPVPVTADAAAGRHHVAPFFLPDGRRILFSDGATHDASDSRLMVQSLDGGDARLVMAAAADGRLLPSGQLVFMRLGTLMIVPFDVGRAQVTGDAVVAMGGVMQSGNQGRTGASTTAAGMFAVSSLGSLVFVRGTLTGLEETPMIWVTPDGRSSSAEPGAGAPTGPREFMRISPDGSRAVASVWTKTSHGFWIADWTRDRWTECIDCGAGISRAMWSPAGTHLAFGRSVTGKPGMIVSHALDSSTPDQVLVEENDRGLEVDRWLQDGRLVYNSTDGSARKKDIKLLDPGSHTGRLVASVGIASVWDVSPDGRWLAYDQNTQTEIKGDVFVQAIPGPGPRIQISADGGGDPAWSADGRTLYYLHRRESKDALFAVDINASSGAPGKPHELFQRPDLQMTFSSRSYDVAGDGQRFLMRDTAARRASVTSMELVINWTDALLNGR